MRDKLVSWPHAFIHGKYDLPLYFVRLNRSLLGWSVQEGLLTLRSCLRGLAGE